MTIQSGHHIDARRPDIEKVKQLLNNFLGRFEVGNKRTLLKLHKI